MKQFIYGMRLRPFSIGTFPKKGFIELAEKVEDYIDKDKLERDYWDFLIYGEELTEEAKSDYDLDLVGIKEG